MSNTITAGLDPAPPRPADGLALPEPTLRLRVDVEVAHLANPLLATSRLLASEAGAVARVTGDEVCFEVAVALPDTDRAAEDAEAWVRWAVHNSGIRGTVQRLS